MTDKLRAAMQQAIEFIVDCEYGKAELALREALDGQAECKECGAKQAQIDRLMLEYCPDEMTPEQMREWGNNQRPVEQAEQDPVAWMYDWEFDGKQVKDWVTSDINMTGFNNGHNVRPLYTAPVRTKDLTDDEIHQAFYSRNTGLINGIRAVIAADRELNK